MKLPVKSMDRSTRRTIRDVVLIVVGVLIATAADVLNRMYLVRRLRILNDELAVEIAATMKTPH